jgi:cysteinyl-tRNA synthetase
MAAGHSAALRLQPPTVAVRLPPLRTPGGLAYPDGRGAANHRTATARQASPTTVGANALSSSVASRIPARDIPRQGTPAREYLTFVLTLAASALVGATATVLLWQGDRRPASIDAAVLEQFQAANRQEATSYRGAREQPARPVVSWEAESSFSDQPVPKTFAREIKTVKFIAPAAQDVLAALSPVTGGNRASVAVPMGKPPEVKSWRYQLQGVNPYVVAGSSADLVVIDYSGDNGAFTRAQVEQMQRKPDGSRRIMLSYMSIGEAEDYRWYWPNRSSTWLGPENPKWRGNYGVRFWHPDWQQIIFEYVDKIVAAGFDGVYLDKVDEFEEMGHRDEMVEFVARIAARAKSQRPDFMIVSQNGDALIPDPKFRRAIDAFAREDLFYGENSDGVRNKASSIREGVRRLKMLRDEGKPVFVVEYPRNEEQAKTARREIAENKFIGLMAKRELDQLER